MITAADSLRLRPLREAARKANCRILKSLAPNNIDDFGGYQVIDNSHNCVLFGSRCELDLTDLEVIFSVREVAHAYAPS